MLMNMARNPKDAFALIHEALDHATIVHVFGELDLSSANELEVAIAAADASGKGIVIDLEPCTYIDSSILAVLIRAFKKHSSRLSIVLAPTGTVTRLFELTSLKQVLPIVPSLLE